MENLHLFSVHCQQQLPLTGRFLIEKWAEILGIGIPTVKRKCEQFKIRVLPGWIIVAEWWWVAMDQADAQPMEDPECHVDEPTAKARSSRKRRGDTE